MINYRLMFGNGAGNKGEKNKGKKVYGLLGFKPAKGLYLEAYGDYETQERDTSYYVLQGFGSYESDWGRIGVLFARRHFKQEGGGESKKNNYDILSLFAVVKASSNIEFIGRLDRMFGDGFEKNYNGREISYIPFASNPQAPFNLIIGGVSWEAAKNVRIIPNIKYVIYSAPERGAISEKPSEDIYANMTVYFKF
jgi:hypothetical protein